ncbi:MAG: hypothetical protein KBB52_07765 [Candidatus Omnitrophica bacterium]|nr:hypothetical protein [Candidatus Omnitrophota bacterium]
MIEINLLPQEYRKKEPRFKGVEISQLNLQKIPVIYILVVTVAILIIAQITIFLSGIYARARLTDLEKRYSTIKPDKQKFDELSSRVSATKKKITAIDELMGKRSTWARKLSDLSDSMTPGIWLTNLSYDERATERIIPRTNTKGSADGALPPIKQLTVNRNLIISGYAAGADEQGAALVGKLIKSMKENPGLSDEFSDIILGSIKSEKVEGQDVMNFRITCIFKENSR